MNDYYIDNKVYYHDTDAGGVVYYAAYLEHLEEGRTAYLISKGIDPAEYGQNGILFPVVHIEIDYKYPARYGQTIRIFTKIEKMGNASIKFSQEIKNGDITLVTATIVCACIDADFAPTRIPQEIREKLIK